MKKTLKYLILTAFLITFTAPSIFSLAEPQPAQTTTKTFVMGDQSAVGNWDPAIWVSAPINTYLTSCLETLVWIDQNNVAHELLATNWTVYPRPAEAGYSPGVKAIAFSLRDNVTFHDGSEFNATVVEWNLNRSTYISGAVNSTARGAFFIDTAVVKPYYTANWNLSQIYPGAYVPIINKTEVINPLLINITVNTWTIDVQAFASNSLAMMSMAAYLPWSTQTINGTGQFPSFPQDNPAVFPGHMIGTGPYKFDYIDETVQQKGHMVKNENYWNKTALEAGGWFSITDVYVRHLATTEAKTTGLLTDELDYGGDLMQVKITDHDAVLADPYLEYHDRRLDPAKVVTIFTCEEGLSAPTPFEAPFYGMSPRAIWSLLTGQTLPQGVNRTIRQALSYSFNYDAYWNIGEKWGNQTHSPLSLNSPFYNPAIPEPYYDVTRARQIVLSDPYYAGLCAARGLGITNSTEQWNYIAENDPIVTHNMTYQTGHPDLGETMGQFMEKALNDIGGKLEHAGVADLWLNFVMAGLSPSTDMFAMMVGGGEPNPWGTFYGYYHSRNLFIPYFKFNIAFMVNTTFDTKVMAQYFRNESVQQADWDWCVDCIQNYEVPMLYYSQYRQGMVIQKGWTFHPEMPWRAYPISSCLPYFALIAGNRVPSPPPLIPGYSELLVLFVSGITILGIIYTVMRKRN